MMIKKDKNKAVMEQMLLLTDDLMYSSYDSNKYQDIVFLQLRHPSTLQIEAIGHQCPNLKSLHITQSLDEKQALIEEILKIRSLQQLIIPPVVNMTVIIKLIAKMNLKRLQIKYMDIDQTFLVLLTNSLNNLQQIRFYWFSYFNNDSSKLLKQLKNLTSLTFCKVLHNLDSTLFQHNDIIKSILINLANLRTLKFQRCTFNCGIKINEINQKTELQSFAITGGIIYIQTPQFFDSFLCFMPNLKQIKLSFQSYKGSIKQMSCKTIHNLFQQCKNLTSIDYFGTLNTDTLDTFKQNFNNLKQLTLRFISTDFSIDYFSNFLLSFTKLTKLNLPYFHLVTNKTYKIISQLSQLKQLYLHKQLSLDINPNQSGLIYLKKLKQLRILNIRNSIINNQMLTKLLLNFKYLMKLQIQYNDAYPLLEQNSKVNSLTMKWRQQGQQVSRCWIRGMYED